jgi:pyruvate dehydrogenase (quinone)
MAMTVGDHLWQRLREWGVERVYGYAGDGINGLLGALARAGNDPEFIQARHEETAALMACAHGKFSGEVGVCLATSGPGAIHLLNGLYDARLDHAPVLAIVGQTATTAMGGSYQQEVDLLTLFKDVAGEYVQMVVTPEQLPNAVDRAVRIALTRRTVTALIFPADVQAAEASGLPPHEFKMVPGSLGFSWPTVVPPDDELERAAAVLNEADRVAILVGQGARSAGAEVLELADVLRAGVAKALLGKDVVPDTLPFVTGSVGLLGTKPSWDMLQGCDAFVMIGSSFPYSQFLPEWGTARGVQIDIDAGMVGLRYPMEVNLVGESRATLRALLPRLVRKAGAAEEWRLGIESNVAEWWVTMEDRALTEADPLNPQLLFWELSSRLPDGAIVTVDSGSVTNWYARDVKLRDGMRASVSGTLATMGCAVPYAVAAKFCHPGRPVVALVGDGAMQMNGNAELLTVAKYWEQWDDPRLVVLVLHNNDLNMVTWEMRAFEGDPKFAASQDIPDFDYARFADSCGLRGIRVEKPDAVGPAWDEAFAATRPVVIDAVADPDVPPIPPHVELGHAMATMRAVMAGDPDAAGIVRQSARQSLRSRLPGLG